MSLQLIGVQAAISRTNPGQQWSLTTQWNIFSMEGKNPRKSVELAFEIESWVKSLDFSQCIVIQFIRQMSCWGNFHLN